MDTSVFTTAAMATFGLQGLGFVVAYLLHTELFYDILGGLNYMLLAFLGHTTNGMGQSVVSSARHSSMTCLFLASRGWLLGFLAWRAHSRKGDSRFEEWIQHPPMFFVVWMVQGLWVFLISWPLLVVQALDDDVSSVQQQQQQQQGLLLTLWDKIMLLGFGLGISIEIHADIQKALWVSQGRQGGFCQIGLWNWSRHPNYFGEILQWWCAWCLSLGSVVTVVNNQHKDNSNEAAVTMIFGLLGILSPLFTMNILLNMSGTGIWAAEGKNLKRYYESEHAEAYKEYRASTSPLIPMFGYKDIPLWVKRRFLFEWERFEYQPNKANSKKNE